MSSLDNLKLYYWSGLNRNPASGRGEYVRLLLVDAGVKFEYITYEYMGVVWQAQKQKLKDQKIRDPTLPAIFTADGKYYDKTFPLARFISRKLGKYEGDNEDDYQLLDAYSDIINDWVSSWVKGRFGNEQALKSYTEEFIPQSYKTWNDVLSDRKGPYILGEKVSYTDFALFHIIEEDNDLSCLSSPCCFCRSYQEQTQYQEVSSH